MQRMETPVPDGYNQVRSRQDQNIVELTAISPSSHGASPEPEGDLAMGWAIGEEREVSTTACTMPVAVWDEVLSSDDSERWAGEVVMVELYVGSQVVVVV
jgi:hypothetical protein